ncbi:hypothetical protein [Micromonospora zhanjiangensis]|uniref:Peptidase inhibitor family I36 n=1 Tax=Micromonospora zhanjiangensis TaxID=1522057 RepID=A0ABV8KRG2_9ACTN
MRKVGTTIAAAVITGLSVVAVPATASASSASPASSVASCRYGTQRITGAEMDWTICVDSSGTGVSYFASDTAKDGRRAEVWLRSPATSSSGVKINEATGGVGDWAEGEWYGFYQSGVSLRLCTSDANTDRRCGSWL